MAEILEDIQPEDQGGKWDKYLVKDDNVPTTTSKWDKYLAQDGDVKKKAGGVVSSPTESKFPSLDNKLFGEAAIKPVSESTNFGNADIVNKTKIIESLPFVKDKVIHDKTIKNLLQQGKLAMEGSNSYNEEKQNVSNTLKDEEWVPSSLLPVEKDYVKNKAIRNFSDYNNESPKSIEDKINSGDYILENGKVKVRGGIADNFGQGIKDFVDNIGLSLNISAAQSRGNNNEIKYYMNEFNKNKDKDKEFAAVSLPEKASKTIGELSPYAIAGAVMPYADIPLMGLSNLSSNHQAIWNDDKMTMNEKVNAINNTTKDAFMTGNLQGAAFNSLGISNEKEAKELLTRYAPTQKLYNNFKDVIKTLPSDISKAAAIGGGTEFLNNLTKNKEGVKVDFGSIPEGALNMATLELIMKAPKVFANGFKTLNEAVRTGYDKENPNWYNTYSKNVQDVLNQIVSSPEPVYNKLINLLDVHPDVESEMAKQKIETFRDYYKSLPSDLEQSQKDKALHILQLKTEAISDAQNTQDATIKKSLENKASVYDKILQKVINKEPVDENKEPLLLTRFAAPVQEKKENLPNEKEVIPDEVQMVPVRRLSSEEPPMREGERIVTVTGKTEPERQTAIQQRKKETSVKPQVIELNKLVQDAGSFAKQNKNYKKSSQGLQELNNLRLRVRDLAAKYPEYARIELLKEKIVKPSTTQGAMGKMNVKRAVKYNSKAEGDAIIEENGKVLTDRDKNIQDIFQEFNDSNIFLDFKQDNGKRMSEAQLDATVQDILDGIPSKRANRYLNELEAAIAKDEIPLYDKTIGEQGVSLEMLREATGINKETVGEPMDEKSLMKFLDGESKLTPDEQTELIDNIDNLIHEYEPEFEPKPKAGAKAEIQPVEAKPKEGITPEAEPITDIEKSKPKAEAERGVEDVPKNEKRKLLNSNFEKLLNNEDFYKEFKIKSKCL